MSAQQSFLETYTPWASRSNTPKPNPEKGQDGSSPTGPEKKQGTDHSVSHRHRLSLKDYPSDCPKPIVRWFYAVDAPKRKPRPLDEPAKDAKPLTAPKKYAAFSMRDSRSIETAFHKMAEGEQTAAQEKLSGGDIGEAGHKRAASLADTGSNQNTSINDSTSTEKGGLIKVPVNEDFLFDVDIEQRELAPTYWLGPIYDVRRGSWFYQEGSSLRPCDENLASQLEEGFLKVKPWHNTIEVAQPSASKSRSRPNSMNVGDRPKSTEIPGGKSETPENVKNERSIPAKFELQTQRLFGTYMNSVVTYQDSTVAWILTDDFLSRMSSTVYQRFAGGGHLGGVKVVRGYSEGYKARDAKKETEKPETSIKNAKRRSAGHGTDASVGEQPDHSETPRANTPQPEAQTEPRLLTLERQMSNLVSSPGDPARQEEEARQRDEDEIRDDYKDAAGQDQSREIEHLILVTHGIGQRLGLRMESVNFIHDVNVLRKTLKSVYGTSPDLQALNSEVDSLPKNCRVQVLPVVWRHLLDFPKQSFKQNREQDLTDADNGGDEEYPSLESITVDGVPAIRQLISDLALDILLYQSAYRAHIAGIVQRECNRVYELFMERNPTFSGKVSLVGHSLGSAILFDILCHQKDIPPAAKGLSRRRQHSGAQQTPELSLKFEVEDFYCLGSPLGLYQMLKGRKIAGRRSFSGIPAQSPLEPDALDDPFLSASSTQASGTEDTNTLSIGISSPKCAQLFNIFHPADPIAYRIEPLISNAMSSLKPQPLPYTKKGIFGVQGAGFTGLGARVGQSVSGLWTNITSGVASSLLNRSLGLSGDGQINSSQSMGAPQIQQKQGTSSAGGVSAEMDNPNAKEQLHEHPPTLIESDLETLYAGFEKRRKSHQSDEGRDLGESAAWLEVEQRSKRLRLEEAKVRALNSNGRVDFSVQEGVFDISLIASIASHLSYWADEDVSHFMISQLLSRQRVIKR